MLILTPGSVPTMHKQNYEHLNVNVEDMNSPL